MVVRYRNRFGERIQSGPDQCWLRDSNPHDERVRRPPSYPLDQASSVSTAVSPMDAWASWFAWGTRLMTPKPYHMETRPGAAPGIRDLQSRVCTGSTGREQDGLPWQPWVGDGNSGGTILLGVAGGTRTRAVCLEGSHANR